MLNTIKTVFILALLTFPIATKAQSSKLDSLTTFVGEKYRFPDDSLKSWDQHWMLAIVRVKTNANNKIISYDIINKTPKGLREAFSFLIGYQFPKTAKIDRRPIVFYYTQANPYVPADNAFKAPYQLVEMMTTSLKKILKDDPNTLFINTSLLAITIVNH
ncbi:MAG: hypothetical protein JWR50_2365 [Mucilaginibacter sp.]|nr:hypothetical protein [Mucilaginibacter sp.]